MATITDLSDDILYPILDSVAESERGFSPGDKYYGSWSIDSNYWPKPSDMWLEARDVPDRRAVKGALNAVIFFTVQNLGRVNKQWRSWAMQEAFKYIYWPHMFRKS